MNNKEIERTLRNGYEHLTIEKGNDLFNEPVTLSKGDEWYLDGTDSKKAQRRFAALFKPALALACLVLLFVGINAYQTNFKTFATVYLDVNPSVSLKVNRNEKVIGVKAENHDGEAIIDGMDLEHTDIDVAVNALLGSMIRHGYLDEAHNILLLSVDCDSKEKSNEIRQRLDGDINEYLAAFLDNGKVIDQELDVDPQLEEQSAAYEISPSKAHFINELIEDTDLRFEDLAHLSISEIISILEENGVEHEEIIDEIDDMYDTDDADDTDDIDDEQHEDDQDDYRTDEHDDQKDDASDDDRDDSDDEDDLHESDDEAEDQDDEDDD